MPAKFVSVVADMTKPYTSLESWGYDRFIAPAVLELSRYVVDDLAEGIEPAGTLLDVGCGGGHLLAWLAAEYPQARLTGVDLSPEQVARARARTAQFGGRVDVREGSALELPFAAGSFDAVVSVASIKHWPDPLQGLREIVRVLRPGGVFFVAEVDRGCTLEDAMRFVDGWRLPAPARRLMLPLFRTFVAGNGIDLEDGREMLHKLGLSAAGARRLKGLPAVLVSGTKKGASRPAAKTAPVKAAKRAAKPAPKKSRLRRA